MNYLSTKKSTESNQNDSKLKIGLITDSVLVSEEIFEFVKWCQDQPGLNISHQIIIESSSVQQRSLFDAIRKSCFSILCWLEARLLKKHGIKINDINQNLNILLSTPIKLQESIDENGCINAMSSIGIAKIKELQLDVLLIASSHTIQGEALNTTKLGVISPHFSEEKSTRGCYVGFWEVFHKKDYTGFSISQSINENCGDKILIRGRIRTQHYYSLNKLHIQQKCFHYLKETLTNIALTRQIPESSNAIEKQEKNHGTPSVIDQVKYIVDLGSRLASRFIRSKLKIDFKWSVAYIKNDWQNLDMSSAIKIPNPNNHFLADPFVVRESGRDYCFLEDYDYNTQKGHIAVYELKDDGAVCLGNALIETYHLSFPYMFRYQSELYMCPETSRNRQIRVYKCVNFPLQWQLHSVLMDNVSAADTMLFEKDGRWWMFTNMDIAETGDYCTELNIYWSDSPLSNTWTAHKSNPVFIDASKGRNAGLLFDSENIYRVAQKQSFDFYGKAFTINRIDHLDEKSYKETEIRIVPADFFPNIYGTHHMHSNGKVTVFDFINRQNI